MLVGDYSESKKQDPTRNLERRGGNEGGSVRTEVAPRIPHNMETQGGVWIV